MKKYVFILVLVLAYLNSSAQKFQLGVHAGTFWDNGLNTFMFQKNTYAYTRSTNHYEAGVDASFKIGKNFSVHTGYDYTYRYLEVNLFSNNPVNSFTGTHIYANSIPLLLGYTYENPNWEGKSVFIKAGGGLEIFTPIYSAFGMYATENVSVFAFKYGLFYTIDTPKNPIPFVQGYIGFGDKLGKRGNISIGAGYKLLLSDFTYKMYYYFSDFYNTPIEATFPMSQKISELNIRATYSFGIGKKKSE